MVFTDTRVSHEGSLNAKDTIESVAEAYICGRDRGLFAAAFQSNAEPDSDTWAPGKDRSVPSCSCTFVRYLLLCSFVAVGLSVLAVALWSGMGLGEQLLNILKDAAPYRPAALVSLLLLIVLLYLFDFFWPPHLPGQVLALWDGDKTTKRWLLGIGLALLASLTCLSTKEDPSRPLLFTIALCPLSVAAIRGGLQQPRTLAEQLAEKIAKHGDRRAKSELLQVLVRREEDQLRFMWAALVAFCLSAALVTVIWISWVLGGGQHFTLQNRPGLNTSQTQRRLQVEGLGQQTDEDLEYLLWSTPLVVAVSNFVFGLFVAVRLAAQRSYEATDSCKAQLLADQVAEETGATSLEAVEASKRRWADRADRLSRQLTLLMKVVSMAFVLLLGMLYIAGQLLMAESVMSSAIGGVLGLYFLVFVAFIYLAFRRVVFAMGQWLANQPFWRFIRIVQRSSWTRALIVCVLMPFVPLALCLSLINQRVRCLRRLYDEPGCNRSPSQETCSSVSRAPSVDSIGSPPDSTASMASMLGGIPHPEQLLFTPRVHKMLATVRSWDWLAVLLRCYVLCGCYLCYSICPLLLNIALSWLGLVLMTWSFGVVIVATFFIGIVAFLLPPVPGMTVYIFGGLVISRAAEVGEYGGFWTGSLLNIGLCWFLKLFACAIQQKCIGEGLGQSLWVRKTVGVHKAHIRCIEAILREPGMSVGKVAILCGGPDWPTSVLAGVLRVSLWQCELGTTPIIFFVTPCALTGSFYLKRGVSEVWNRSAKLMIIVSVAVNLLLWAIAAWAIQQQLEKRHEELTRPRVENVDLEWLDYRASKLDEVVRVSWSSVPRSVRWLLAFCTGLQVALCQGLFWCYYMLFGDFQVEDDIHTLDWLDTGEPGRKHVFAALVSPVALGVFICAYSGLLCFLHWRVKATRLPMKEAALGLDAQESEWKQEWLKEARCHQAPDSSSEVRPQSHPTVAASFKDRSCPLPQSLPSLADE